jgi:hypothetical protein
MIVNLRHWKRRIILEFRFGVRASLRRKLRLLLLARAPSLAFWKAAGSESEWLI